MEPAGIRPEEAVSGPPFSSTGRTSNTPPRRLSTTRVRPWESAAPDLPQLYRLGVALWGALSGVGVLGGGGRGGRGAGGGGSLITSCRCRVAQLRNDRLQGEAAEHPRGEYGISLTSTFYSFLRVAGCDCGAGSPPTGGGSTLRGKAGRHPGARYTRARGVARQLRKSGDSTTDGSLGILLGAVERGPAPRGSSARCDHDGCGERDDGGTISRRG